MMYTRVGQTADLMSKLTCQCVFVNKVLLGRSRVHLSLWSVWLLSFDMVESQWQTELSWLAKPKIFTILALSRRAFREGNGNPLQYYCLETPMDGGAW